MNAVFSVLFVQVLLGAFDNFWHHELGARLPQKSSARNELALHSAREAIYGLLYIGLSWLAWHGWWALLPASLLLIELLITCADFLEEDRSRKLPPLERVLHTVLAVSYGLLLGLGAPVFLDWFRQPAALVPVEHGVISLFFTFCGAAVILWSARNAIAATTLREAPLTGVRRDAGPAVLVTGGTGFIGSVLVRSMLRDGRRVIVYARDVLQARRLFGENVWAVDRLGDIPPDTRIAEVVHLAGAPVLGIPWTTKRRKQLMESRTAVMQELLLLMRSLQEPPRVLVAASAVGFYGVTGAGMSVDETAGPEPGRFQSELCVAAEHEARRAEGLGVRVVWLRFGIVLGKSGGAYPGLALAARLGLGAQIGLGDQPVPWVHVDDAVALVQFALEHEGVRGPVNAVAPQVLPQREFVREMAGAFAKTARLRLPSRLLRLTIGEMGELLTEGQWAVPVVALKAGFRFAYPSLGAAMRNLAVKAGRE